MDHHLLAQRRRRDVVAVRKRGEDALRSKALRDRIVSQFTSPSYGWMWPFKKTVERWYDQAVDQLVRAQ